MTLEQLRIFVAVAEREHLTQAATALHLTPSAVSSAIRVLEDRHGAVLFHRIGRRIEITAAGRIFLDEARATLARAEAAELVLTELGDLRRGALVLQASQTIASYWLPQHVVRFHEAHPGVELRLSVGNTETVTRSVLDGSAELGLIEGEINAPALSLRTVAQDRIVVVVAPDHPWAGRRDLSRDEIRGMAWVLREPGSGTRSAFESALQRQGIDPATLNVALELPSNEAVRAAVELGERATAISQLVVASYLIAGRLVRVPFPLPPRAFQLLRHKERHRTRASRTFEAMLTSGDAAGTARPIPPARS
jgi:DNA-binding transcriptional LysR family regulator